MDLDWQIDEYLRKLPDDISVYSDSDVDTITGLEDYHQLVDNDNKESVDSQVDIVLEIGPDLTELAYLHSTLEATEASYNDRLALINADIERQQNLLVGLQNFKKDKQTENRAASKIQKFYRIHSARQKTKAECEAKNRQIEKEQYDRSATFIQTAYRKFLSRQQLDREISKRVESRQLQQELDRRRQAQKEVRRNVRLDAIRKSLAAAVIQRYYRDSVRRKKQAVEERETFERGLEEVRSRTRQNAARKIQRFYRLHLSLKKQRRAEQTQRRLKERDAVNRIAMWWKVQKARRIQPKTFAKATENIVTAPVTITMSTVEEAESPVLKRNDTTDENEASSEENCIGQPLSENSMVGTEKSTPVQVSELDAVQNTTKLHTSREVATSSMSTDSQRTDGDDPIELPRELPNTELDTPNNFQLTSDQPLQIVVHIPEFDYENRDILGTEFLTGISAMPSKFKQNLVSLTVNRSTITNILVSCLPKTIQFLNLDNNKLGSLAISTMPQLVSLSAKNNQLRRFSMRGLKNLIYLDLSHNNLISIDLDVGNFFDRIADVGKSDGQVNVAATSLLYLDLSNNKLVKFHEFKYDDTLAKIRGHSFVITAHIDISSNLLASLDGVLSQWEDECAFLKYFDMGGNYFPDTQRTSSRQGQHVNGFDIFEVKSIIQSGLLNESQVYALTSKIKDLFSSLPGIQTPRVQMQLHKQENVPESPEESPFEATSETTNTRLEHFTTKSASSHTMTSTDCRDDIDGVQVALCAHGQAVAATKIQALWRGYATRKIFQESEQELAEELAWVNNLDDDKQSLDFSDRNIAYESISQVPTNAEQVSVFDYFSNHGDNFDDHTSHRSFYHQSPELPVYPSPAKTETSTQPPTINPPQQMPYAQFHPAYRHETVNSTAEIQHNDEIPKLNLSAEIEHTAVETAVATKSRKPKKSREAPPATVENLASEWNISEETAKLMIQRAKRLRRKPGGQKRSGHVAPRPPSPAGTDRSSSSTYRRTRFRKIK